MNPKQICLLYLIGSLAICQGQTSGTAPKTVGDYTIDNLSILRPEYPKVFFFRHSEVLAANQKITYAEWDADFSQLQGIEGKALGEEIPRDDVRNAEFFTRFKKAHPDQMVLLHFNGNARANTYDISRYFAGDWVYNQGAKILSDVPATPGETEIHISSTKSFLTGIGRYRDRNVDIGLFPVKDGHYDWDHGEQVQLVSVDHQNNIIRVKRGCYGTTPHSFKAGESMAAAHEFEGPWIKNGPLLWIYNFSSHGPRDAQGRNCADVLADELKGLFGPGGRLAAFDGVEFDVAKNSVKGDTDGDGMVDDGMMGGINVYAQGVLQFYSKLRNVLGDNRLILADGMPGGERGFGILNGVETEGFPHTADIHIENWSEGMNRMTFWEREARPPILNYINHKFIDTENKNDLLKNTRALVPISTDRLVLAAAQFFDGAICCSADPAPEPGEKIGIYDEFKEGKANKLNWLGKLVGPPVHLAEQADNLLANTPVPAPVVKEGNQVLTEEFDCRPPDLFVTVRASCAPLNGFPASYARRMSVYITGEAPKTGSDKRLPFSTPMSWVNGTEFESTFYFRDMTSTHAKLTIEIEGTEPVTVTQITAHSAPDVVYRAFEHGLVLANPSPHPYTFDLSKLMPGISYTHLQGSAYQDPVVNNGMPVTNNSVTLGPIDGLFLLKSGGHSP
jgi:hypothetical protein